MHFDDFVLQFDTSSRGELRARVLKSPFGEGMVGFSLPPLGLEPGGVGASRHLSPAVAPPGLAARPPAEIGAELYRSVFQGQVRTLLDKSRGQLERSTDLGLRLKIKIDPNDRETGALADLPWELLCDETEDFLALSRQTSLVRYLDVPRSSQPILFTPPLKILAVGASPRDLPALALDEEMQRLEDLARSASGITVRLLSHASAGAVREALSEDSYNVLHFMGHGTFDAATGEGMLAFEAADGSLELVSGRAFATKLRDVRSLGVVMLNACDTARACHQGGANPFRGVATALVLGGVPGVVAMQRPISDRAAIGFSAAFYRHLSRGDSIDEALTEGRQAIYSALPETFEWATPVLFLRMPEGNVFVAKPAGRREEMAPPAPATPETGASAATVASAATPSVPRAPGPGRSRRRLAIQIASGAAGVVLVSSVLYTKVLARSTDPIPTTVDRSGVQEEPSPRRAGGLQPPSGDSGAKPAGARAEPLLNSGKGRKATAAKPPDSAVSRSGPSTGPRAASVPVPVPPAVVPGGSGIGGIGRTGGTAEIVAPVADLSRLSAQVLTIVRREEGGLRVTVAFKNAGDQPLSAVLDAESSILSDNQGQSYSVLDSDLPSSGANPRLDLAAGASAPHTFDFQAPKVGSQQFHLALATPDGRRIKVTGPPVTLEGSP
jgi:hypothetical protein